MDLTLYKFNEDLHQLLLLVTGRIPDNYLLRLGECASYRIPKYNWVVRLARGSSVETFNQCKKELKVAKFLNDKGFDTVSPIISDIEQPIKLNNTTATIWNFLDHHPLSPPIETRLGGLLRNFHQLMLSYKEVLQGFLPIEQSESRLEVMINSNRKDYNDIDFLLRQCDALKNKFKSFRSKFGIQPIHGDFHNGNILQVSERYYLHDYQDVSLGPKEWDLIGPLIAYKRFHLDKRSLDNFYHGYGYDLRTHTEHNTIYDIREIYIVTWLMQNRYLTKKFYNEVTNRLKSIKNRHKHIKWNVL